jgi:hypothetical protein
LVDELAESYDNEDVVALGIQTTVVLEKRERQCPHCHKIIFFTLSPKKAKVEILMLDFVD